MRFARAVVDWFADHVAAQVHGKLIHYSQRQALMRTAERLGISRFHANLIIAVALNDADKETPATTLQLRPPRRWEFLLHALVVVAVETLIAWGAWRVFQGV